MYAPPKIYRECSAHNTPSCKGWTSLMNLVSKIRPHPDMTRHIKMILSVAPDQINIQNEYGYTALMLICNQNQLNLEYFNLLLEGTNLNLKNHENETALSLAINFNQCMEAIHLMINCGAKCDIVNIYGKNLLHREFNNSTLAKILIDNDADVNRQDFEGKTPLMYAFKSYNEELIDLLSEKGADINIADVDGNTVAMLFQNRTSIVKARSLGIDFEKCNCEGSTALRVAASRDLDKVKILAENGANLASLEPIMFDLFCSKKYQYIDYLLDEGINTDFIFEDKTLLMRLFRTRTLFQKDLILKLIRLSDLAIEDKNGDTTYNYYVKSLYVGDNDILQLLQCSSLIKSSRKN